MGSEDLFKQRRGQLRQRKKNIIKRVPYRYLIVCEGQKTEPNYFKAIADIFNSKYNQQENVERQIKLVMEGKGKKKIQVNDEEQIELVIEGTGRKTNNLVEFTEYLINRSIMPSYGHIWVIFDKDSFTNQQFNSAIEQAHMKGYNVGWSNEAIELWFLLHFEYLKSGISREQYCEKLTNYFTQIGIGKYAKNMENIYYILTNYGDFKQAVKRSKRLIQMHEEVGNCNSKSKMKPATTVFNLVLELNQYIEEAN